MPVPFCIQLDSRFLTDMGGMRRHMKKTYIFMMLAGLSLAGAPFITSGFWSKDAIFAALLDSGYSYSWDYFVWPLSLL